MLDIQRQSYSRIIAVSLAGGALTVKAAVLVDDQRVVRRGSRRAYPSYAWPSAAVHQT